MTKVCPDCGDASCVQASFILCPICEGYGGRCCEGELVPGIIPGHNPEGGNITCCTYYGDAELTALVHDTKPSLLIALRYCRDKVLKDA